MDTAFLGNLENIGMVSLGDLVPVRAKQVPLKVQASAALAVKAAALGALGIIAVEAAELGA